jgi:threonine/homoserine/homoserine lactone efflux protein
MDALFENIKTILFMNAAILVIPGVNFLLIARLSLLHGRREGLICALGITSAIMLHVIFALASVNVLLKSHPSLFDLVRICGAGFLLYLGTRFLLLAFRSYKQEEDGEQNPDRKGSFLAGFVVDLLNPFVSIFYLSLFAALEVDGMGVQASLTYSAVIFFLTLVWFSIVALAFSNQKLQAAFRGKDRWIQCLSGLAMYYFGARVVFGF